MKHYDTPPTSQQYSNRVLGQRGALVNHVKKHKGGGITKSGRGKGEAPPYKTLNDAKGMPSSEAALSILVSPCRRSAPQNWHCAKMGMDEDHMPSELSLLTRS